MLCINKSSKFASFIWYTSRRTRICTILRKLFAVLQQKIHVTEPYLNIHMIQALEKLLGCFVIKYVCILMNALEQLLAYLPYVAYASWKFVFYGNSFHFGIYFGMFNYVKFSACVNTPVHLKSLHHKWNVNI